MGTLLAISVDVEMIRTKTGCRIVYELGTLPLQLSVPEANDFPYFLIVDPLV